MSVSIPLQPVIDELRKAGMSDKDILSGGLEATLKLSAAGALGVADAAGIVADTRGRFELAGEDMPGVADLLAAGGAE